MSPRVSGFFLACATLLVAACNDPTLSWQLDHDRIVAVRATPPHIPADGKSALDILITSEADGPAVVQPMLAAAVPPDAAMGGMGGEPGIEASVRVLPEAGVWTVTAPDAATIDAARSALGLPPDMLVPIRIGVTVEIAGQQLAAIKTVHLGGEQENPTLGAVTIGEQPAADDLAFPIATDVPLTVAAEDTFDIDWLASFGNLSDNEDTLATWRAEEPADGQIAVVIRDDMGGVAWGVWQVQATE